MTVFHLSTTYDKLVDAFGEPTYGPSDDGKSLATWDFHLDFGWGELYDFKSYAAQVEDVTVWHVQGDNDRVVEWILSGGGKFEGSSADS